MEAHGGYAFCGIAALTLLGHEKLCDTDALLVSTVPMVTLLQTTTTSIRIALIHFSLSNYTNNPKMWLCCRQVNAVEQVYSFLSTLCSFLLT